MTGVGLQFCTVYSFGHWISLCNAPLTILVLSWHIFLGSRRADERALQVPKHALSIFLMMLPLAVAIFEAGDGEKFVTQTDYRGKQTSEEKRKALKQVMIKEGPRPGQVVLLSFIWTTSFFLALERMFNTQPVKKTLPTREYSIQPAENSSKEILILRNVDISYCPVWEPNVSDGDKVFWAILVLIPLLIGPLLASFLEFMYFLKKKVSKTAYPETPSVLNYWLMILFTSIVILMTFFRKLSSLYAFYA